MKRVHLSKMVAHLWANQSQEEARNSGNYFYFQGPTIYSFGPHFPIASFLPSGYLLWNDRSYSMRTSKHQSDTRRALSQAQWNNAIFIAVGSRIETSDLIELATLQAQEFMDKIATKKRHSRERSTYIEKYNSRIDALDKLTGTVHPREDFTLEPKLFNAQTEARNRAKAIARVTKEFSAISERKLRSSNDYYHWVNDFDKARAKAVKLDIALCQCTDLAYVETRDKYAALLVRRWRKGEPNVQLPKQDSHLVRINGDQFETSGGARVPLSVANMVWRAVNEARNRKTLITFPHNSASAIGSFHLDNIDAEGNATIGCHKILYPEFKRLAKELGL